MPDTNKAFFITSVSNGHVLANRADGRPSGVVAENKGDQGDAEKWTIEASDEPNKVALKNAANGQYLHANGNKCWATVGTGEKQWWKISSDGVTAPGACRLSPAEYPDVYLNHFQGKAVRKGAVGMKVHMWTWTPEHESWFTWYLLDTSFTFNPLTSGAGAEGATKADFDSKLKALEEREKTLTEQDQTRSADWDKKNKELQDRQASSAQDEEKRTSSYDQKLKDLQAREDVLSEREQQANSSKDKSDSDDAGKAKDQAEREADVQRKLDSISATEKKVEADRAALEKSQSDLEKKEKDIAQREKAVKESDASKTPDTTTNGNASSDNSAKDELAAERTALEKMQSDLAKREKAISQREKDLENSNASKPSAPTTNADTVSDKSGEQKLAADRAALQKAQNDLTKRETAISEREKALESSNGTKTPEKTTNGDAASDKSADQRLEKTRQDNANLEQRLAKLEDQLSKMAKSSGKASDGKPQTNGKASAPTPSTNSADPPGCGYKHYKPPRKLNKKLIGMIYEK